MLYRIEFFELVAKPTRDVATAFDAMTSLSREAVAPLQVGAYMRELWKLDAKPQVVRGQFRKFRQTDLPEIGALGAEAEEIELAPGEGLIEKNFFALYKQQSLLVWHGNGNANTPSQFAKMLSNVLGTGVEANPLVQGNALQRLMKGDLMLRKLEVSIPRPRDPQYYPDDKFSQSLLDALGAADGDRIRVSITTDGRIHEKPHLAAKVKRAIKELVTDEAVSSARVDAIEDGVLHPIDLIADRITSMQEIEHDGRYPPARSMYQAFDAARDEENEAIDAILGANGNRVA